MNPATIAAIATAAVAVIGAVTALVKSMNAQKTVKAHVAAYEADVKAQQTHPEQVTGYIPLKEG
jgi:hypothetical protein